MSEPKICYLNRKPYRDKFGNVRQRYKCCGKRETRCTLMKQPDGVIIKTATGQHIHENLLEAAE